MDARNARDTTHYTLHACMRYTLYTHNIPGGLTFSTLCTHFTHHNGSGPDNETDTQKDTQTDTQTDT